VSARVSRLIIVRNAEVYGLTVESSINLSNELGRAPTNKNIEIMSGAMKGARVGTTMTTRNLATKEEGGVRIQLERYLISSKNSSCIANMKTLIDSLKWRYATNVFDTSKEISKQDLYTILEAGNLAATAFGLQPFEFVVIKDRAVKDSLVQHAYGQEHIAKNSALVVLAIRTDINESYITEYVERIGRIRGVSVEMLEDFKQLMLSAMGMKGVEGRNAWAQKQAYIALGTMMAAASELRIDNHCAEGFDPEKFDEVLGLKAKNLHATVLLMLGYRTDTPDNKEKMLQIKVRKEYDNIVSVI